MNSILKGNEGFYQEKDLPVRQAERARAANNDAIQTVLLVFGPDPSMQTLTGAGFDPGSARELLQASMRVKARRSP